MDDLLSEVQNGLKARKGTWQKIADALAPDISYSWIAQVGRGKYDSAPSYERLRIVAAYLRSHPLEEAAA